MNIHKKWKVTKRVRAFKNRWWDIVDETVRLPDGGTVHFFISRSAGGVIVFPFTPTGEVVFVRQYKHGARSVVTELPIGRIDPGERDPKRAAARELLEETGYRAERLELVRSSFPFPTSSNSRLWFYIGHNCKRVRAPMHTPTERTEVLLVPMEKIRGFLRGEKIVSLTHVGAIYTALDRLGKL